MNDICPICSSILLRHLHQHEIAWFCSKCRQEMPNLHVVKVSTMRKNFLQKGSYQYQQGLSSNRQKYKNISVQSMVIDLLIYEGKKRLEIVSFIISQTNSIFLNTNFKAHDESIKTKDNRDKILLTDFLKASETILLNICQAILARDISIVNNQLSQRLKSNCVQLNLPINLIIYWLYGIKASVMDLISSITDLSDSLVQRNQRYLALEIASYFDLVIASMI